MSEFDITEDSNVNFLSRQVANRTNNYELFLEGLYNALDDCFAHLEKNANHHQGDGETKISYVVQTILNTKNYNCEFETNRNGHVDLLVKENKFEWLAEAKIHGGNVWTYHGFRQLTENYTTGRPGTNHGGIIVYNLTKQKPSTKCAAEWREYIESQPIEVECKDYTPYGYFDMTIMEHPRSGFPFHIRNYFVNLQYTPSEVFDNET